MAISLVLTVWAGIMVSGSARAQQEELPPPLTMPPPLSTLPSSSRPAGPGSSSTTEQEGEPTTSTTEQEGELTTSTTIGPPATVVTSTSLLPAEAPGTTTASVSLVASTDTADPGGESGLPALSAEARPLLPSMSPPVAPPEINDPDVLAEELTLMTQPAPTHRMPISRAVEQSRLWWDGLVKIWFGLPLWWQGALGTGLALLLLLGGARSAVRLMAIGRQLWQPGPAGEIPSDGDALPLRGQSEHAFPTDDQ
jgi:hypothetical protein